MNPHAFSFRSSPRTSASAVGERETALGSQPCRHRAHTYSHTPFSQRPGTTWTSPSLFPDFSPLVARTPVPAAGSPGRRGFENHRPKTDHTYKTFPFPVLLRVLRTPDTPHTHLHSLSSLAITIVQYTITRFCVCVFSRSLFRFHGARNFGTLHLIFPD